MPYVSPEDSGPAPVDPDDKKPAAVPERGQAPSTAASLPTAQVRSPYASLRDAHQRVVLKTAGRGLTYGLFVASGWLTGPWLDFVFIIADGRQGRLAKGAVGAAEVDVPCLYARQ